MTNIVINDCHNYIILVILKWKCLDPKVAVWLLNPDSPTASFEQIVKTYTDQKQVHVYTLKFGSLLLFFQSNKYTHASATNSTLWWGWNPLLTYFSILVYTLVYHPVANTAGWLDKSCHMTLVKVIIILLC